MDTGGARKTPPAKLITDWDDVHTRKQSRERNLLALATTPDLGHDAAIGEWNTSVLTLPLYQRGHIVIPALGSYECSSV